MASDKKFYRFHMTGCGHCTDMEKAWRGMTAKMKKKYGGRVTILDINASDKDKYEGGNSVSSYPTMVYIHDGKVERYEGGRSESDLVSWVEAKVGQEGGARKRRRRRNTRKKTRRKSRMRRKTKRR